MNNKQRSTKLLAAMGLIREVLDGLDHSTKTCSACEHVNYADRDHYQAHLTLTGVLNKLQRWSGYFDAAAKEENDGKPVTW